MNFPITSDPKLNPKAAPFQPQNTLPPPPPPPFPFFLQPQCYYYYRRETRVLRTFSKFRRSPPKPFTKPLRKFVPPRQRKPTYRKTFFPQRKPNNSFSGNLNRRRNGVAGDGRTSVMIKNIPNSFRRHMMIELLDKLSAENHLKYDFLYFPMDFVRCNSLGYAFVNFTTAGGATKIRELLWGYKWSSYQTEGANKCISGSKKICAVNYARLQGKKALVRHFQNSIFRCKDEEWLPVVFAPPRNGSNATTTEQIIIGKWIVKD